MMEDVKAKLMEKITQTSDEGLLKHLYEIIDQSEDGTSMTFNEDQWALIRKSEREITEGNFSSHDQIENEMAQWLKK